MRNLKILSLLLFLSLLFSSRLALCNTDLEDGISKYDDDGIAKDDEIGKADQNIKFIVMNAKSKAAMIKNGQSQNGKTGTTSGSNMNSVVLGAGSQVKGPIYIIDQSKGPKTNISE